MKKFSELSNNPKVEESNSKQDFIKNLVEEALTVVDGVIVGKETLVETLNKIITLNDSKTKIQVLESVKVNAYRGGFDFNLITGAIEAEKAKLNAPIEEKEERDVFFAQPNDKIVSISESVETEEVVEEVVEESVEETEEEIIEESVEETEEEVVEETEEIIEEGKDDDCDDCDDDKEDDDCDDDKEDDKPEDDEEDLVEESVEETTDEVIGESVENDEGYTIDDLYEQGAEFIQEAADLLSEKGTPEWDEINNSDPSDVISKLEDFGGEEAGYLISAIQQVEESVADFPQEEEYDEELEESVQVVEEKKEEKCEECDEEDKEGEEDCGDECDDDDKEEPVKESVEEETEETEEVVEEIEEDDSLVEKVTYVVTDEMREISDLASLCEGIINEHHLETKKEKIQFILDNEKDKKKGRKEELENMSDKEIDAVYTKLEIDLGLTD